MRITALAALAPLCLAGGPAAASLLVPDMSVSSQRTTAGTDDLCGWYMILSCNRDRDAAAVTFFNMGGPAIGGPRGASVLETAKIPNFSSGWFCVASGPYASEKDLISLPWPQEFPEAFMKHACGSGASRADTNN